MATIHGRTDIIRYGHDCFLIREPNAVFVLDIEASIIEIDGADHCMLVIDTYHFRMKHTRRITIYLDTCVHKRLKKSTRYFENVPMVESIRDEQRDGDSTLCDATKRVEKCL